MEFIVELDNEFRAIGHECLRLQELNKQRKIYTKNEKRLQDILDKRLNNMVDMVTAFKELLNKLQELDDFEIMYGIDVIEVLKIAEQITLEN